MDPDTAMKRLALWALIARTSENWRRAHKAMSHGIGIEDTTGISIMMPVMDEWHAWAERTYGDKARDHAWWGML